MRRTVRRDAIDRISDTRVRWELDATTRTPAARAVRAQEAGTVVEDIERRIDTSGIQWSGRDLGDASASLDRPRGTDE